jgi:hypothetical protein
MRKDNSKCYMGALMKNRWVLDVYIKGQMQKFWAFDFIALLDKDT